MDDGDDGPPRRGRPAYPEPSLDRPTRSSDARVPAGEVYDWYTRGVALLDAGDAAAAAEVLAHACEAEPDSRSVREALGRALFVSRRYAGAAESFGHIVEQSPSDDYARFGLGLALSRMGDFEAAVEHLALAVAMRPEKTEYVNALRGVRATLRARGER